MAVTEEPFGAVGKARRIKISRRDTAVNDLKNSTVQGILALFADLLGAALLIFGLVRSFLFSGKAGYEVGILMIGALLFFVLAIVLGAVGLRNHRKIRHYNEVRAIVIAGIFLTALTALFVYGIILLL